MIWSTRFSLHSLTQLWTETSKKITWKHYLVLVLTLNTKDRRMINIHIRQSLTLLSNLSKWNKSTNNQVIRLKSKNPPNKLLKVQSRLNIGKLKYKLNIKFKSKTQVLSLQANNMTIKRRDNSLKCTKLNMNLIINGIQNKEIARSLISLYKTKAIDYIINDY